MSVSIIMGSSYGISFNCKNKITHILRLGKLLEQAKKGKITNPAELKEEILENCSECKEWYQENIESP